MTIYIMEIESAIQQIKPEMTNDEVLYFSEKIWQHFLGFQSLY
ncbi:MAG: hypothetical protein V7784_03025 [Oceanospirillaceae bacterium]